MPMVVGILREISDRIEPVCTSNGTEYSPPRSNSLFAFFISFDTDISAVIARV